MGNIVCNQSLGRWAELVNRVENNDPTNSAIIVCVVNNNGSTTDATVKDYDDLNAILGDANITERTANGWSRTTWSDSAANTVTVDDTNDRVEVDGPDITWSSVSTDNATDLVFGYDSDTTGGTDANIVAGLQLDFAVTADGSDVTAQFGADGYYQAS